MTRTYHSVNITKEQQEFLKLLDDYEIDIFSIVDIEKTLNAEFVNLNAILENLANKNFLSRIEQGKYCRINFRDEKVIGCFISDSGSVGYWSALNYYGLTEQFPNNVFIQTPRIKKNKVIFGTEYKFVKIAPNKIAGILTQGQGTRKYMITDIDKTIVDCFDLPEHSGGYVELIRAFNQAKLNSDKMIEYCIAIDNIAATKRMGFLAELFDKKSLKTFVKFAKQRVNVKYNVFDPAENDKGEFINEWRLRLNISRKEILDICNNSKI